MVQAVLVGTCCAPVLVCLVVTEQGGCGGLKAVQNLDFPVGEWVSVGKALLQRQTSLSAEWGKT